MNKINENKLAPKLRFPEFVNDGEWDEKSVGQVFNSFSGSTPNTSRKEFYGGEIPFIRSAEIGKESTELFLTQEGLKNSSAKLVNKGDLLVALYGANSGEVAISKLDGAINQAILCLQSPHSNEFTYQFLFHKKSWIISKYIQGGQGNLSGEIVKSIELGFPKKEEQQKIAACLSSLDDLITAERQKLEVLKEHKKGLLQNLFPSCLNHDSFDLHDGHDSKNQGNQENHKNQGSDNVPKLRFKEFEESGEWAVKTLGELYEFKVTNSFSRDCLNYQIGSVKNIHYGDIHTKFNTLFDITKEIVPFINSDISIEKIKIDCYCQEGDIILADASEDLNDVGKSIEVVNLNNEDLVSGLHTLLARQRVNSFQIGFAGYLFKSDWIRRQIQREAQGAKVLGISASRISSIKIKFPPDKNEQQKIATTLSSIDELIIAQGKKIEALQLHKKGLLQGLFPNVNKQNG